MTLYYPVILKKLAHTYRAEFCDLDGCYGEGKDMEDALDDARNEGISYILSELDSDALLPPHSEAEEIPLEKGEQLVMLALVLPREENWNWLG